MAGLAVVETISQSSDVENLVVNAVVKNIRSLAEKAFKRGRIVVYTGRTGIGKSEGVKALPNALKFPHRIIRCKQTTSLSSMIRGLALGERIHTLKPGSALSNDEYYQQIVSAARSQKFLVVIDEADRLKANCLECLRDLWDDARLPVLMIGNEDLEEIIAARHERLARRIGVRFTQRDLRREQLREVIEAHQVRVSDEEFEKLYDVCGGSPGWAFAVLETRDDIAESYGSQPTIEHLLGALKYFPSLGK